MPKLFRYVTDFSGYFNKRESDNLERRMADIERQFPGLTLSIYTMEVFHQFKPREYFFWLMNRCLFGPMENRLEKNFTLVLFIDSTSKTIVLSTGFGLHQALPETVLEQTIEKAIPFLQKERYFEGTMHILSEIKRQLKSYCTTGTPAKIAENTPEPQAGLKPVEDVF